MMDIPGVMAVHVEISANCRATHGMNGALERGLLEVEKEYKNMMGYTPNEKAKFHLVLTVERPAVKS